MAGGADSHRGGAARRLVRRGDRGVAKFAPHPRTARQGQAPLAPRQRPVKPPCGGKFSTCRNDQTGKLKTCRHNRKGTSTMEPEPLGSVHTAGFPLLLEGLGLSVLVTTYQ